MKNLEKFLEELTELSQRHGLVIVPGCCGYPSVIAVDRQPVYEIRNDGEHLHARPVQRDLN